MTSKPTRSRHDVADALRSDISRGVYPRGSALPSEERLAQKYSVSRPTINNAVKILVAEGLVRVQHGKGMTVTELTPILRNAVARYQPAARERNGGRGAYDTEIRERGQEPRSEQVVERREAPVEVAEILGTADCVVRARKMFADNHPTQLADSYIPLEIAAGTPMEEADSGPGGIISRFADSGLEQVRISERIEVRPPTGDEARLLGMSEGQRVYVIYHTGWTAQGRPVEVCMHIMPTHLWILEYEFPIV